MKITYYVPICPVRWTQQQLPRYQWVNGGLERPETWLVSGENDLQIQVDRLLDYHTIECYFRIYRRKEEKVSCCSFQDASGQGSWPVTPRGTPAGPHGFHMRWWWWWGGWIGGRGGWGPLPSESGLGGTPVCPPVQRIAMGPLQSLRCVRVPSLPYSPSLLLKHFHCHYPLIWYQT